MDLPGREVRERDPAVEVDAQLERNRPEVARHVTGVEPFRELFRVPDGRGERHDLEVRVRLSEPREAHLEGRAALGVSHEVHLVRDDHAQPIEPGGPTAKESVGLLARSDEDVELLETVRRKVEIPDRDPDLEPQLRELLELLRFLVRERPQRNEVEARTARPRCPEEREVRYQGLSARRGAGEDEAL